MTTKKRRGPGASAGPKSDAEARQRHLAVQADAARQARTVLIDAHARRTRVSSVVEAARETRVLQTAHEVLSVTLRDLVRRQLESAGWRVVTDAQDPGRWRWDPVDGLFVFDLLGLAWLGSPYDARVDSSSWIRIRMCLDPDEDLDRALDRLARQAAGVRAAVEASEAVALRAGATDATPIPAAHTPALVPALEGVELAPPRVGARGEGEAPERDTGAGPGGRDP